MNTMKNGAIERKIINVTGKRQITIPLKFFEQLRLGKQVECFIAGDAIIIRPLSASDDNFTLEILKDLVAQGYGGNELVEKFAEQRQNIQKAIAVLVNDADKIAARKLKATKTQDIFGDK